MKIKTCKFEGAVSKAIVSGNWENSLQTHVSKCPICYEVVQIARWMQKLSHPSEDPQGLPDAKLIWWRAKLIEKQSADDHSLRPIEIAVLSAIAVSTLLLGTWITWTWPQIQPLLLNALYRQSDFPWSEFSTISIVEPLIAIVGVASYWILDSLIIES